MSLRKINTGIVIMVLYELLGFEGETIKSLLWMSVWTSRTAKKVVMMTMTMTTMGSLALVL
jgi:hypothetical protein